MMEVDILHHCSSFHPFNGNIFYHFEYFIFLLKRGVDVRLVYTPGYDIEYIISVMEDRYDLKGLSYRNRIFNDGITRTSNVITNTKVLYDVKGEIKADKIHLVNTWASYYYKDDIGKYKQDKNIIEYNECPLIGDVNYLRPIYFDLLKKPNISEDRVYLHLSGVRKINFREYVKYVLPIIKGRKVLVSYPESQKDEFFYLKTSNVESYISHVPNLFEKFNTYFYILLHGKDYSPRMLIESTYLGKEIIYINRTQNLSNRYKDCLCKEIEKYRMSENDKLLGCFL